MDKENTNKVNVPGNIPTVNDRRILDRGRARRVVLDTPRADGVVDKPTFKYMTREEGYTLKRLKVTTRPLSLLSCPRKLFERFTGMKPTNTYTAFEVYNVGKDELIIEASYSPTDCNIHICDMDKTKDEKQKDGTAIQFSELFFGLVYRATNGKPENIKTISQQLISNEDTARIILGYLALWDKVEDQAFIVVERMSKDEKETQMFNYLLGTPNANFIERMLDAHRTAFGGRKIMRIAVDAVSLNMMVELGTPIGL